MHPNNKMKTRSQSTQGTRPPRESNQPGVEKCNAESATSLEKHSDGNHAQGDLPAGPSRVTPTKKNLLEATQKILLEYGEIVIVMLG